MPTKTNTPEQPTQNPHETPTKPEGLSRFVIEEGLDKVQGGMARQGCVTTTADGGGGGGGGGGEA